MIICGTHYEARLEAINIISNNEDVQTVDIFYNPAEKKWCIDYNEILEEEREYLIDIKRY